MPELTSARSLKEIPQKHLRRAIKVSQQYIPTGVNHIYSYELSDDITLSKCFFVGKEQSEPSEIFYQLHFEVDYNYLDELSIQPFTEIICLNENKEQIYAEALDLITDSINVRKSYSSSTSSNGSRRSSRVTYHVSANCIVPDNFVKALQKSQQIRITPFAKSVKSTLSNLHFKRQRYWLKAITLVQHKDFPIKQQS
ncbi:hypothetical protein PVA45_06955 [Entomospira entomophila]|uniref:Uncharacterized protein n=1 Tax=Entomospira entomophila TaxID=2719988 RepID=A0A968G9U7_9SPIO|nr:hypothetical protein [Entomospira entomophilus]NIZ41240.1 hypothetical protein [Entomospira entomophilus]WDI35445.1 hypothetical protein PVA45_06955 [Entomospira entomophilus]